MLTDGKTHDYMKIVQGYAHMNGLICSIPWIAAVFPYLPKPKAFERLYQFARDRVSERLPLGTGPSDIFSHFLREDRVTKKKYKRKDLDVECVSLIIGGQSACKVSTQINSCQLTFDFRLRYNV